MDYWPTLKPPEESQSPSDGSGWRILTDAVRGRRQLRVDGAGRPLAWLDAAGTRLDFAHDPEGNLRRISCGDWSLAIDGPTAERTLRVTDPAGETDLSLAKAGRVRTITRGGDSVSIELDSLERVRRVVLPGSLNPLAYAWDEEGGCEIGPEGGGALLTLSEQGAARRVAIGPADHWDEEVQPGRVRLRAVTAGTERDMLEIRLAGLAAIAERRWRDGSCERFERDDRGRLSSWASFAADGAHESGSWRYGAQGLAEDVAGRRTLDEGGRVLRLDRPDGSHVAYRYDAAGRRIARTDAAGETRYVYDPLGTLAAIHIAGGEERRLETDGMGRRVAVRGGGGAARHEHRDETGRLWAVTDDRGRALHTYVWIGDRIAARIDGPIGAPLAEAYLCDPLGTPNGVFIATGGEWRFERLAAPPFGRADDSARPTLYGHFGDPGTGLIHCGARELDPELGLFLTPDPWHGGEDDPRRWAGAPASLLEQERERPREGFHDYALCRFDPLGRYDRDGHVSGGDVFLHVLRWILMPTWGFPLTAVSLYFFQPINLYMEIVGLIVWGFKQFCEDKSHPWGNHTIAKATWLLGSSRQCTFAFGLNGFLPRVVLGGDRRARTIGNVVWISSEELDFLARPEVVEVDDIGGGPAGTKFNDDPAKESVVALAATDAKGRMRLHVSAWTRGLGNSVAPRAGDQAFADVAPAAAIAAGARGAIHLRHPVPLGMAVPRDEGAAERLEVREFVHGPGDSTVDLETLADAWFALRVPHETGFSRGQWLRVTAPNAADPKPDAAFRRIRDMLPAPDHIAMILAEPLPARFETRNLSTGLRIEAVGTLEDSASAGWTAAPGTPTLVRTIAPGAPPADFPPDLAADSMIRIDAATPAPAPLLQGLPVGDPVNTRFTGVKALRARLTLAPDHAGAAAGTALRRVAPTGALFHGSVELAAQSARIRLTAPHPPIAANDLLVVSRAGGASAYVRATAAPAAGLLVVEPALPAALVPANATAVDLQRIAEGGADAGGASVAAVAGADLDVTIPRARLFATGNLVRLDIGGVPALRRIEAIPRMEIDVADEPVGTGDLTLTRATADPQRARSDVQLAPPGRFLKWTGGAPLSTLGTWPDKLLGIHLPSHFGYETEDAAYHVRWPAAGPPGTIHPDFHRIWSIVTEGADQFLVLESPLPLIHRRNDAGTMKTWWRNDPDIVWGYSDLAIDPVPVPFTVQAREFTAGAVRADRPGRRVLAHEPEALVPENPTVHDTHRRALIEHEIHHTVQCNYWGPLLGAFPLPGLIMVASDIAEAAGAQIPDWLHQVDRDASGNPPSTAEGRIPDNTELNPFQVFSIGGMMQLFWKYLFLAPFRLKPEFANSINGWDFEDFNVVFNPVSRLITQNLPQVNSNAPPGERWLAMLGQTLAKGLDLRSWTPPLGLILLLPDGPGNFIEQGASRASGDLYSTILTANDRYNLLTRGPGSGFDSSGNIRSALGRPVRLLMFGGTRTDRLFAAAKADQPGKSVIFRDWFRTVDPFVITLPDPAQRILFDKSLYEVRRPAGAAALPIVSIEGPPPNHTPTDFVVATTGDTVVPRLRALVPLPPRVSRSLGFYLIAAAPGRLTIASPDAYVVDAEVKIGGTVAAGSGITLTATAATLAGSPVSIGPATASAGQTAADLAQALAARIAGDPSLNAAGLAADSSGDMLRIRQRRGQEPRIQWAAQPTGGITATVTSGNAARQDPRTNAVTITVGGEVRFGGDLVEWSEPVGAPALPALSPALRRFQTEEPELRFREPRSPARDEFVDAGIANLVLDISDPAVAGTPLPGNVGWKLTMPVAVPAAPVRLRLYRIIRTDDPAFDLAFPDVPSLAGRRSYLEGDTFVLVRDLLFAVEALPDLPAVTQPSAQPLELTLPIRLVAGARGIVVTPPAGVAAPPVTRIGDDGRGERWRIGPLAEPPGEDAVFRVTVTYGRPGRSVDKSFDLTLTPPISVTGASYDMRPGLPLELDVAGGTPPYTVALAPALPGLAATQPAGKIRLLATTAPDTVTDVTVTVTDSANPPAHIVRHVSVKHMPPILAPNSSNDYLEYVRPATLGLAAGLINGRSSGGAGPNVDLAEAIDAMERAVTALGAGDSVYLSAWYFSPTTPLRVGGIGGVVDWGGLLARKAGDGVRIRLLINDFDPITSMYGSVQTWLGELDALIAALPAAKRDNLKYVVSLHPAHLGRLKSRLAAAFGGLRPEDLRDGTIYIASHHQKFMLVRKGTEMTAFCGGIDIETMRTPVAWSDAGLSGWHDIHVQLQGPITRDLEGEFIARWNRERNASTRAPVAGWTAMEELTPTALSPAEDVPAKKPHLMQMLRTVSVDGTLAPYDTRRDDIRQVYRRAIHGATNFLYLENQYFRSVELGEWIAEAGTANPGLIVIMVVVAFAERDDGPGALTQHGNYLQLETLSRIATALGPRVGFYTMANRLVHSKFVLVDDAWMTIGSANANGRSFELDTELNLQISDATLARDFRTRLWAHNLGKSQADVSAWPVGDFLGQWNSVAAANGAIAVPAMAGEGIVSFDYRSVPGRRHMQIPDGLVQLDFGTDGGTIGNRVG